MNTKAQRKKQQLNNDEINFDEYLLQLKRILFKLFAFYNKRITALHKFIIYALTFVEFLQTLFFIVNPQLEIYKGNGPIVSAFGSILSYLSGYAFVKMNSGPMNFFLLLSTFLWLLFCLFLVYFSFLKIAKQQTLEIDSNYKHGPIDSEKAIGASKLQTFLINMCVGHILLINSVLAIPYFCIIFPVFYCTQFSLISYSVFGSDQCYDLSHIISMGLGLFSIIIVLGLKAVCIFLIFERNPLKKSIYACHSNISILFKTGGNIACILYLMVDPQLMFKPLYIGGLAVVYGQYLLIFRWQQVGFYDKFYMNFVLCLEILLVCFSGNNILQYFFGSATNLGIGFIQFVLASCMIAYSAMSVVNMTNKKIVREFYCTPQSMKKSQQAQNLVIQLIYHLITQPNINLRSNNIRVFLKQLDRSIGSKLEQKEHQFVNQVNKYLQKKQTLTQKNQKILVYQYFRILLQELIDIKSCFMFQALKCAFLFEYGLKTKAMCQIYKIQAGKLDWMEDFFIYEIKQRNCVTHSNTQDGSSQSFEQIDQQRIIIYDQYISLMSRMEQAIVDSILANKQFWSQISQENPDFEYVKKLTKRLSDSHTQILKIHNKIQSIFENSLKQKFLFFSYLQVLEQSKDHTQAMVQFLQQNQEFTQERQNKKMIMDEIDEGKYSVGFEQNEKIVMIELDFTSFEGIIKNCNSQIYSFLGYTKSQLIGRKIDKLLPGPIAQKHPRFLQNFINRRDSISKSSQRVVYAVHKDRFIVPGFLTIKVISNEQTGLKLMSFIRPLSQQTRSFGLMTTANDTIILGVSRQIMLKIKDEQFIQDIKNESVYLELLFPKLKVQDMKPNEFYEAQMSTLNNIERQFEGESSTKVYIKYQEKHYQQDLHLRYYNIRLTNKLGKYIMGTQAALDVSFLELKHHQVTTTRLIENFQAKKEQQRRTKMQQLCRFKQNYLSKYNPTKYFMCLSIFLVIVTAAVWETLHVFQKGKGFGEIVQWNRMKLQNINLIIRDLSELQSEWINVQLKDDSHSLEKYKTLYSSIVDRYNSNLQKFKVNTESNDLESIFNINVLPSKSNRFKSFITVQTQSQQFTQILPINQRQASDETIYLIQRNAILVHTRKLLCFYIDDELSFNLGTQSQFEEILEIKFTFGLCTVIILGVFSVSVYFAVNKIRSTLDKNLELMGYLSYSEVCMIVNSLTDYLRLRLSSQLQSIDQFDNVQKIVSESKVSSPNGAKFSDGTRLSNESRYLKNQKFKSRNGRSRHGDSIDQSSLHFEIHSRTNDLDQQSELIQPLGIIEHSNPDKKNFNHYRRKPNISQIEMLTQRVTSGSIINSKGLLKMENQQQPKKKISFLNEFHDSQFEGLELSPEAIEQQKNQQDNYSHTQIMFRHNPKSNKSIKINSKSKPQRKQSERQKTRSSAPIQLPYTGNYKVIIFCLVMVAIYGGITYMTYQMERTQEEALIEYEDSINKLIRISGKLMFLRSFIRPYFCELKDEDENLIIGENTLSQEIKKLQTYTTVSFPQLQQTQLILKNIYRDIGLYIYLLKEQTPSPAYLLDPSFMPQELSAGITRIEENFLSRHEQILQEINLIDSESKQKQQQLQMTYIMKMLSSMLMVVGILGLEYYLVVWRLKVDERATFKIVEFFPLRVIAANKNLYKAIKKQTSKFDM